MQQYTIEFKALAVRQVNGGLTVGAAAKELGLVDQTLRKWVKSAAAGTLNGEGAPVVTPEQMELLRLHAENVRLMREHGIRACHKPQYKVTTDSRLTCSGAELAESRLHAIGPEPDLDIGRHLLLWTKEGWLYLAIMFALFNREVVG